MKILFPMRDDIFRKSGGDRLQVERYLSLLQKNYSASAKIVNHSKFNRVDADIVHLTNIDRPIDTYAAFRRAKLLKIPVVLSPIHHSYKEIESYERLGRHGWFSIMGGLMTFQQLELARSLVRTLKNPGNLENLTRSFINGIEATQRDILTQSDWIFCLSKREHQTIESDFSVNISNVDFIPNGFESASGRQSSPSARLVDVLVVGRIEARKNQIRILEALETIGVKGVFVGAINENHGRYAKLFLDKIKESRFGSTYLGAQPQDKIFDLYANSKVHVSASWYEVMSLVDIEAAAAGCKVVASKCGATVDFLNNYAYYVEPSSLDSLTSSIQSALHDATFNHGTNIDLKVFESWEQVVDRIYHRYAALV